MQGNPHVDSPLKIPTPPVTTLSLYHGLLIIPKIEKKSGGLYRHQPNRQRDISRSKA